MKKLVYLAFLLSGILLASSCFAGPNAPESIAGITIGNNISSIHSLIKMDTASSPWQEEYIKKIQVRDMEGYKGGYIVVGNCKRVDTVLRIKLKYADSSLSFFDKLYGKLEKRFGKPNDWRGNPFGTLKVWKWSLKDEKGNISLIMQHFSGDDDSITQGNSIRLSRPGWIEEEKECWDTTHPEPDEIPIPAKVKGINWFLPN